MNTVTVGRGVCPPFDSALRGCEDIEWVIRLQERSRDVAVIESDDSFFRIHVGPRHRNGRRVRLDASMQLLGLHARHYRAHPQQKAYRLFRIGYMYFEEQEFREAFRYAIASLFLRPNRWAMALVKDIVAKYLTATRRQGKSGVARC